MIDDYSEIHFNNNDESGKLNHWHICYDGRSVISGSEDLIKRIFARDYEKQFGYEILSPQQYREKVWGFNRDY